jgi:hypothetical protein
MRPGTPEGALKMPFIVDTQATFASAISMGVIPREVFGQPGVQEKTSAGVPRWTAGIAVSYNPDPGTGMTPPAEVLNITINAAEDPGLACPPGTAVTFEILRGDVSAPQAKPNGRVSGGKLYWSVLHLAPAVSSSFRSKSDAA